MDDELVDLRRNGRMTDDEYEARMTQARARAAFDLGSSGWADVILLAFMQPDADRVALAEEME